MSNSHFRFLVEYFQRKLIESSQIPPEFFKSYSRRERKRKIKNLFV